MWAAIPFIMHFKGQGLTTPPPQLPSNPPPPSSPIQGYLALGCLLSGLLQWDVVTLPEWDELVAEFHRAPRMWWGK